MEIGAGLRRLHKNRYLPIYWNFIFSAL